MDFQQPPSPLFELRTSFLWCLFGLKLTPPRNFRKNIVLAVSLGLPDSQLCQARDNIVRYYERLDKLYAKVVTTGKGLFLEADHCKADAIIISSGSHDYLGDDSEEQDVSAATRARENIQRSITILHDIYDTLMDDKKSLREFEYLYGGGYGVFPVLHSMSAVDWEDEDQVRGVKELVQGWSSGEFEIEFEPLLEEVEGRWQAAEEQRAVTVHRRLFSSIDRGPETVCESAERETMGATTPMVENRKRTRSDHY